MPHLYRRDATDHGPDKYGAYFHANQAKLRIAQMPAAEYGTDVEVWSFVVHALGGD